MIIINNYCFYPPLPVLECSIPPQHSTTRPVLPPNTPFELCRTMLPDDTNPAGNVHGGTILKMIEQAGEIVANRHCNQTYRNISSVEGPLMSALVRVDHMDFHEPVFVGEVGQLQAAVTFTTPHSLEVTVDVWAENVLMGHQRHTNTARLWYVGIPLMDQLKGSQIERIASIPPLTGLSKDQQSQGEQRYNAQKIARAVSTADKSLYFAHKHAGLNYEAEEHTVLYSQTTLANIVLPSDCNFTGHSTGGALMKKMDEAAFICASNHCKRPALTANAHRRNQFPQHNTLWGRSICDCEANVHQCPVYGDGGGC